MSTAFISGASYGIGEALAYALARRGYNLILAARSEDKLQSLKHSLESACGIKVTVRSCDLSELSEVESLCADLDEVKEDLTLVVNNAGFGYFGPMAAMESKIIEQMVNLNCLSLTRLSLKAAEIFAAKGEGKILNVASTAAFEACPYLGVYAATKAYVLSFSEALSLELKNSPVKITCLCPGPTRTHFGQRAGFKEDSPFERYAMEAEEVASMALDALDHNRIIKVCGRLNALGAVLAQICPRPLVRKIATYLLLKMH